ESVIDTRVDIELADPARCERALDGGDERPHQAAPTVRGIDEHVQKTGAALCPRGSSDRESDKGLAVPARHDHGMAVGRLPSHLALRECTGAPLVAFELEHPWAELTPRGRIERDGLDHRRHQRLVIPTTRASPARSLITRVSPPSEYSRKIGRASCRERGESTGGDGFEKRERRRD